MARIYVAGGGTGGHLYPGLALAESLQESGHEVEFIGSRRGLEARIVEPKGFILHRVESRGLAGTGLQKLFAGIEILWGALQCLGLFLKKRPDLVIATGGYTSAPACFASVLLRVPFVLLEQNVMPGKVVKLFSSLAKRVCTSFVATAERLPSQAKVVHTGNPLRKEITCYTREQARIALGLDEDRPMILVTGASQGSASINEAIFSGVEKWRDKPWTIYHLTGKMHFEQLEERVQELGLEEDALEYELIDFTEHMGMLYKACDLVVCRAGATTIAELTVLGCAAVVVPYPFAGGHQELNAEELVEAKGALQIRDEMVIKELAGKIEELIGHPERLGEMRENIQSLSHPRALERVLEECSPWISQIKH